MHVHSHIFNVTTHVSCLLGGKLIRVNVYLSPKVKVALSSPVLLEADVNHSESLWTAPTQLHSSDAGRSFIMHRPSSGLSSNNGLFPNTYPAGPLRSLRSFRIQR